MHNCPNCGIALSRFEAFTHGNVTISESSEIVFRGQRVPLAPAIKLITEALIRANGRPMSRDALMNVIGGDIMERSIDVYVRRARLSFQKIDPRFAQIICVRGLRGYRWEKKELEQPNLRLVA